MTYKIEFDDEAKVVIAKFKKSNPQITNAAYGTVKFP